MIRCQMALDILVHGSIAGPVNLAALAAAAVVVVEVFVSVRLVRCGADSVCLCCVSRWCGDRIFMKWVVYCDICAVHSCSESFDAPRERRRRRLLLPFRLFREWVHSRYIGGNLAGRAKSVLDGISV